MKRISLLICVTGSMLSLMAGCVPSWFVAASNDPITGERVIVGNVNEVAVSTQAFLKKRNFNAVATQSGEAIKIAVQTGKAGAKFELILTGERTAQGERTHMRFRWIDGRDDPTAIWILGEMAKEQRRT